MKGKNAMKAGECTQHAGNVVESASRGGPQGEAVPGKRKPARRARPGRAHACVRACARARHTRGRDSYGAASATDKSLPIARSPSFRCLRGSCTTAGCCRLHGRRRGGRTQSVGQSHTAQRMAHDVHSAAGAALGYVTEADHIRTQVQERCERRRRAEALRASPGARLPARKLPRRTSEGAGDAARLLGPRLPD